MKRIMIVKKTDLSGTSTKHINVEDNESFQDLVYMEVTAEQLKERHDKYWNKNLYN